MKSNRNRRRIRTLVLALSVLLLSGIAVGAILFFKHKKAPDLPVPPVATDTQTDTATIPEPVPDPADCDPAEEQGIALEVFASQTFSAKHMLVFDLTAETVLYAKEETAPIYPASTTKLLTALTALDYATETTSFPVGSELSLVGKGSSVAGLKAGQILTLRQILDAMLIPSGNDAAYVIAANIGRILADDPEVPDREAVQLFLQKMNEKAYSLGARSTHFTCPDGYPDAEHISTAEDMMKIAAAAASNEFILQSAGKAYANYTLSDGTVLELETTNMLLLPSSKFYYEDSFGLKTGYTAQAGQCVIGGARAYGHLILVTVYNAPDSDSRWKDCRTAFDAASSVVTQAQQIYQAAA